MYCIYKIENKINGKVYIGLTKNYKDRMKTHCRSMNKKQTKHLPLYKSMAKHGIINFEFSIIENGLSEEDVGEREIFYIKKYNSQNKDFGYNVLPGGFNYLCEKIKKQQNTIYSKNSSGREFKGVSQLRPTSTFNVAIIIYGSRLNDAGHRTKIEAAWQHDILSLKHKGLDVYLNFPNGKTEEIIWEQLISRKALASSFYTYSNICYNENKNKYIVKIGNVCSRKRFKEIKANTKEECLCLLNEFIEQYKPLKEHRGCSLIAKRSYESLYGPIEDLITEEELEIAYKDLGTFSNKHVDSLFPELEGRGWK